MAVASPKQTAQPAPMRPPVAEAATEATVPEFSKEQEDSPPSATCCASGGSRRRPANYTEWA